MGEAKRRGSFEDRKQQSVKRRAEEDARRTAELMRRRELEMKREAERIRNLPPTQRREALIHRSSGLGRAALYAAATAALAAPSRAGTVIIDPTRKRED